jgi:beta-xylosidase
MMVVRHGDTYYMFAEGLNDRAQLLSSPDGVHWKLLGTLDIRLTEGSPLSPGPFGTPTAWFEDGTWYLFYERRDAAVWLAKSKDLRVWTNVQDDPVLRPGPAHYDERAIALNQIMKYKGRYYAYYHGIGPKTNGNWTTNVASSSDLIHWTKYPQNPLLPVEANKSSGIVVDDGHGLRLYTMHDQVHVHFPRGNGIGKK